ncbi:MAG: hypothetical protein J6T59_05515 [Bacteroidales bacterium]|nr:hypothetical protein [Bacteroidales bacterium]
MKKLLLLSFILSLVLNSMGQVVLLYPNCVKSQSTQEALAQEDSDFVKDGLAMSPFHPRAHTGHFRTLRLLDTMRLELYSKETKETLKRFPDFSNDYDDVVHWFNDQSVGFRVVMRGADTLFLDNVLGMVFDTVLPKFHPNGLDVLAFMPDYDDWSSVSSIQVWSVKDGHWDLMDYKPANEQDSVRPLYRDGKWWVQAWMPYSDEVAWQPLEDNTAYHHLCGLEAHCSEMDTVLFRSMVKKDLKQMHFLDRQGYAAEQLPEIVDPNCWPIISGQHFYYQSFASQDQVYFLHLFPLKDEFRNMRYHTRGYKARLTPQPDYVEQRVVNGYLVLLYVSNPTAEKERTLQHLSQVVRKYLKKRK